MKFWGDTFEWYDISTIAVVGDQDPMLSEISFEVDVHERAIEEGPYQWMKRLSE